ncbi:hypothetical protein [Ulvibacterium sp.]|uniref:hypothetical protein n=1 Tax=Ulvibacterium sp. TaxID=2665914 RepID=UPI00261133A8|nr:hypothetical protein [Ulvibacterium sp.]
MDSETRKLFEKQDWEYIIKDLTYYAYSRFKFWNLLYEKGIKGYSPEEITYEAIEAVLSGKWKWNPKKADLLSYLKFHVVRGMVANLARNEEVKTSNPIDILEVNHDDDYSAEENFNANQILGIIKNELDKETVLYDLFILMNEGMKRKDICEELKISNREYNNLIRKLKSRLEKMDKKQIFDSLKK